MSRNDRLPQHMTTSSDRFWIQITRTLPADKIGPEVALSIMEKAMNRRRVGVNLGICLIATLGAYTAAKRLSRDRVERAKKLEEEHGR